MPDGQTPRTLELLRGVRSGEYLSHLLEPELPELEARRIAAAIVAARETVGKATSWDDLRELPGIDEEVLPRVVRALERSTPRMERELRRQRDLTASGAATLGPEEGTGPSDRPHVVDAWTRLEARDGRTAIVTYEVAADPSAGSGAALRAVGRPLATSVPSGLPTLNEMATEEIQARLGCSPEHAVLVSEARPFRRPEDVLRDRRLAAIFGPRDLERMARWFPPAAAMAHLEGRIAAAATSELGTLYGSRVLDGGATRAFLAFPEGSEMLSADIEGGGIDLSTVRLFGHLPHELARLDDAARGRVRDLLHGREAWFASGLHHERLVLPGLERPVHLLSRNLTALQHLTRSPWRSHTARGLKSNGCTVVPDFDFRRCCEEHDRCYNSGGTDADRLRCDSALWQCIRRAYGHTLRASLYYWGVRVLGGGAFVPGGDPATATAIATVVRRGKPGAEGAQCTAVIKLERVHYGGGGEGDELQFEITANQDAQLAGASGGGSPLVQRVRLPSGLVRHGQSYTWPIPRDGEFAGQGGVTLWQNSLAPVPCGMTLRVPLQITEVGSADGAAFWVQFVCNNDFKTASVELQVGRAVFTFDLFITGICRIAGGGTAIGTP